MSAQLHCTYSELKFHAHIIFIYTCVYRWIDVMSYIVMLVIESSNITEAVGVTK
jgi:hypothetical protein